MALDGALCPPALGAGHCPHGTRRHGVAPVLSARHSTRNSRSIARQQRNIRRPIALSTLKNRGWGARSAVFFVISHLLHDIKCKNHRRLPKTIGEVPGFSQIKPKTKKIVRGERQEIAHRGLYLPHKVCIVPFWHAKKFTRVTLGSTKLAQAQHFFSVSCVLFGAQCPTNSSFALTRRSNNPLYGV